MKKRIALAVLAGLLIAVLLPVRKASANQKLTFIAVNEVLPSELINCVVQDRDGAVYVPSTVFYNYGLSFYYYYFSSRSTAYLAYDDKQMFFELNTGDTYDGNNFHYSTSALVWNGTVYLPIALVYRYFGGFSYSTLSGSEYGDILRLKTDAMVLSDSEFARAAEPAMRIYYEDYYSARVPVETAIPTPIPPVVTASPAPTEEDHRGERASLSFVGLPDEQLLRALQKAQMRPCFFLTAEEVKADPNMVRRLSGEGYVLGVYCREDPQREWRETSALLFEATWVLPLLAAGTPEAEAALDAAAEEMKWVDCDFSTCPGDTGVVLPEYLLPLLEESTGDIELRLGCGSGGTELLTQLLQYLNAQRYELVTLREID